MSENGKINLQFNSGENKELYFSDSSKDAERGCVGHLRIDFGRDGDEFWTSWFDHQENLKTEEFKQEFDDVINELRKTVLSNFNEMSSVCSLHRDCSVEGSYCFKVETDRYEYYLRCIPSAGSYNAYCYCYDKEQQELSQSYKEEQIDGLKM